MTFIRDLYIIQSKQKLSLRSRKQFWRGFSYGETQSLMVFHTFDFLDDFSFEGLRAFLCPSFVCSRWLGQGFFLSSAAISAFCNAGLIFWQYTSLVAFSTDPLINLVLAAF